VARRARGTRPLGASLGVEIELEPFEDLIEGTARAQIQRRDEAIIHE
jgi:hypothetical protein